MIKKSKLWLVTASNFLFSIMFICLAWFKEDELDMFFGPDEVMRDPERTFHKFGMGTFLISVTVVAGIISAVLICRLRGKRKQKIINLIIIVINTCFWTWLYIEDYYFYYMPDLPECFMPWP